MKKALSILTRVAAAVGLMGAISGGPADAQQSSIFKTHEDAQRYLEQNPRGPLAKEAFRFLVYLNMSGKIPDYSNQLATRSVGPVVRTGVDLSSDGVSDIISEISGAGQVTSVVY